MVDRIAPQVLNGRCPLCVEMYGLQGKPANFGSDPTCAFGDEGHVFNPDNWNCALMDVLRNEAERVWNENPPTPGVVMLSNENQHCAVIHVTGLLADAPDDPAFEPDFLILSWYKRRGKTEGAWLMGESTMQPLDFTHAMQIIDGLKARG